MDEANRQKASYTKILELDMNTEYDFVEVMQRTRRVVELLKFSLGDQTKFSTAVSEIARNALRYAGGGRLEFMIRLNATQTLLVRISDKGPGIPDLEGIMSGRRRGIGIIGAKRLVEEFDIETAPGKGTTVVLGKQIPARAKMLTDADIESIIRKIDATEPQSAFDELRRQQHELLRAMQELQQRQEELARLNNELEDTNRGMIALYAELEEKADSLRRADETKTRLLSSVSHELRTPVNAIMALSRILTDQSDENLPPEQRKQAELINKSAEALSELVNDLLDLEKLEAGKVDVKPDTIRIPELFSALRGMMRPLQTNKDVELVFDEPAGLPTLYADESKLAQILRNLVSNALKYTEKGEVRISASRDSTGRMLIFKVSDTGIGISPKDQERIFEEFVQLKTHLQLIRKGTGLGLSISRKLAELLGGSLTVISDIGKGSTFSVALPVVYRGPIEKLTPEAKALPRTDPTRHPVLVVDDNPHDISTCEDYLKDTKFVVVPANDLKDARALLEKMKPVAIVLDLLLPGESGFNLLREVKANPLTADIPMFIASITTDAEQGLEIGADAFTTKPIEKQWLLDHLNEATKRVTREKVLLIDDEEPTRYLIGQFLSTTRYQVVQVESGRKGLEELEKGGFFAVILDLLMPGMSGFEVLQQMRENPKTQNLPVIINTGKELSASDKDILKRFDVAAVTAKTFEFHRTPDALRTALVRAARWKETKAAEEVKAFA